MPMSLKTSKKCPRISLISIAIALLLFIQVIDQVKSRESGIANNNRKRRQSDDEESSTDEPNGDNIVHRSGRYKPRVISTTERPATRRVTATPYKPPATPRGEPRYVAPSLRFYSNYEVRRVPFVGAIFKDFFGDSDDISVYDWLPGGIPSFCGRRWCPPFKIVCKNEFYEVRQYVDITLATAYIDAESYKLRGLDAGYELVYAYFKGDNKEYINLPLTFPIEFFGPLLGSANEEDFLYDFLKKGAAPGASLPIGPPYNTYPPTPLSPQVKISYVKGPLVYVSAFGGSVFPSVALAKAETFFKVLKLNHQKIDGNFTFKKYYNQFSGSNYVNEIHVPVIGVEKSRHGYYHEKYHQGYC